MDQKNSEKKGLSHTDSAEFIPTKLLKSDRHFAYGESSGNNIKYRKMSKLGDLVAISEELPEWNIIYHRDDMSDVTNRLKSFYSVWEYFPCDPLELARAGFYSLCDKDKVKCYSCGKILGDFTAVDNIWEEHAFYAPYCKHLREVKGQDFIRNVEKRWRQHMGYDI